MWEFCENEDDHLIKTLLHDLLHYYEIKYCEKLSFDSLTKTLFDQVKEIEGSFGEVRKGLSGLISVFQEDFDSDYIDNQINLMMDSIEKNH